MGEHDPRLPLEEELKRLKVKLSASTDHDIKQALKLRVEALEFQLQQLREAEAARAAAAGSADAVDAPEKEASPEQIRKAEELIRLARVEKIRKNQARAEALMKEAAAVAPTAPAVLESVGDELSERKRFKEARDSYAKALKFAKHNVELEKKHAVAALRAKGMGSFDGAMRSEGADPLFLTSQDSLASGSGAVWFNAIMPGMGHLVVGKTVAGVILIGLTVCWVVWLALMKQDLAALVAFGHGKSQPNLVVLMPMLGLLATYVIGFTSLGAGSRANPRKDAARPLPPIDLPFE